MGEHTAYLVPPTQAGQVQMHADRADTPPRDGEIGPDRSARLEHRERNRRGLDQLDPLAHEQSIAVPAQTVRLHRQRDGPVVRRRVNGVERKHGHAAPEAAVHLLQRDDVGIDLAQDAQDALVIAPPVEPYGLVNVVAGERDLQPEAPTDLLTVTNLCPRTADCQGRSLSQCVEQRPVPRRQAQRSFVALNVKSGLRSC